MPAGWSSTITPQRVLILGATGGTGQHVVSQALQQGHHVTVLVRNPERLAATSDHLRVVIGSITDSSRALDAAVSGQDVVISALGVGGSLKPAGLIGQSGPALVRSMETQGVRRLIFTSAYGVGATRRDVPLLPRIVMRLLLRNIYMDKAAGEEALRRSALDWTLVYPVTLPLAPRVPDSVARERRRLPAQSNRGQHVLKDGRLDQLLRFHGQRRNPSRSRASERATQDAAAN